MLDKFEDRFYAVKKVRLHLPFDENTDLRSELKKHRVFREVQALASADTH